MSGQRGFTLVEFAIVSAMSAMIVFTLATFYINAQHMWIDSSLQAVAQRDASLFVDHMADHAAVADNAYLANASELHLFLNGTQTCTIRWTPGQTHAVLKEFDSVGNETSSTLWPATGEVASLKFSIPAGSARLVRLDSLVVVTSPGEQVFLSTTYPLLNRP